ncbi:MAG: hypothetical protein INR62_03045 [Rhodospirillales bacterium]|nr:hypothetical protein [Acetobacter sp.]
MRSTLRLPSLDELPRLRAFLPAPPTAIYRLATACDTPSPERIIAATAGWLAGPDRCDGLNRVAFCRWRITPRWEATDTTLMPDLLDAARISAATAGARTLHTANLIPEGSFAAVCLAAHRWTVTSRNEFFEGRPDDTGNRLDRTYQRLLASPEGPAVFARLRVGALTPDLFPAVCNLVAREGLIAADELMRGLDQLDRPGGWSRIGSRVLLTADADPTLAAVVLVRLEATTATVDAQVVDREICAGAGISVGSANVLLLRAGLASWRRSGGGTRLRFRAHPEIHRQTANFARRCGAALVDASCTWQCRLTS